MAERDDLTVFPGGGRPLVDSVPAQIGTYRIIREIGRGGMGAVYEALQAQPQRRVALKLIRADQMSDELLRRFSVEVQALGRLGHVGIARIYEGGTTVTEAGSQPYFVMELVDGLPLDEYVATQHIGVRQCVRLMATVAAAVHHAHQQDVIHRDLKPANILVDATGQPKILDFGVARMVGTERLSAAVATHTEVGAIVGTLQYMSPEQAEGDPDHFDQRSDVYALGVILYKLLAGRLPIDSPAASSTPSTSSRVQHPSGLATSTAGCAAILNGSSIGRSRRNDSTGIRPRKSSPTIFSVWRTAGRSRYRVGRLAPGCGAGRCGRTTFARRAGRARSDTV